MKLVVCETSSAVNLHLREDVDGSRHYKTGLRPSEQFFCRIPAQTGWDTQLPVPKSARTLDKKRGWCQKCVDAFIIIEDAEKAGFGDPTTLTE